VIRHHLQARLVGSKKFPGGLYPTSGVQRRSVQHPVGDAFPADPVAAFLPPTRTHFYELAFLLPLSLSWETPRFALKTFSGRTDFRDFPPHQYFLSRDRFDIMFGCLLVLIPFARDLSVPPFQILPVGIRLLLMVFSLTASVLVRPVFTTPFVSR